MNVVVFSSSDPLHIKQFTAISPLSSLTVSDSRRLDRVAEYSELWYTGCVASSIPAREGGVSRMLISFLLSVLAGIVCHYLCKWLDG